MINYVNTGSPLSKAQSFVLYDKNILLQFQIIHGNTDFSNTPTPIQTSHAHEDIYHILLFTGSDGNIFYKKKEYEEKKGLLLLVSPGEAHNLSAGQKPTSYHEVTFSLYKEGEPIKPPLPDFKYLLNLYAGETLPQLLNPYLADSWHRNMGDEIFFRMLTSLNRGDKRGIRTGLLSLNSLFDYIINLTGSPEKERLPGETAPYPMERARLYIEKNYNQNISASELAGLVPCSPGHFFRQFKKTYRTTAISYQMSLRIEGAKNLIRVGERSFKEIAFHLGFSDVYHFSRIFKRETGVTPGQFRKSLI